jgi:hypothetical protein
MKTQQVIKGQKRMLNMNIDRELYHKAKVFAAERDTTMTSVIEHLLRQELSNCRHDF